MERLFNAPEIVNLIFQSYDKLEDGLSLASTCPLRPSAVSATNLVCDAFQANQVPILPSPVLELGARKPDICELKQVRDLQHLARCIEHMYFHGNCEDQMHSLADEHPVPCEERIRMRSRFHYAIYRVLLVGAILTREYVEPLFLGIINGPPGFLSRVTAIGQDEAQDELVGLTQEDIAYLEQFPIYDLEAGQEESHSFLAAHAHIVDKLFHKYEFYPGYDNRTPPPFPGRTRKVSVALLGIFRPEEVSMPELVEDSSNCYLMNELLVPKEQLTPWAAEIKSVLDVLYFQSGGLELRNGFPSPPPALRFIDFILAKCFRARFKDDLFYQESARYYLEQYQFRFLQDPYLFRDRSLMGTTWLFAKVPQDKAVPSVLGQSSACKGEAGRLGGIIVSVERSYT
ncbi:hypothetical protein NEMBOFW57_009617 [Staphylotrichum longicolle]|uniref:Uncharacterized protein n=1 Tax=Staphylotrichum longicolle TaxID=669026 RepID=A0AAD4EPE7_9PEZI|nr:hypothetical protein NEMBOFW57_009617 [Staphylotrichum longicolle]